MEVAPDPVALLGHGEPPGLGVEAGVVDRDPGMPGEQLDQAQVADRELRRAALVGQIEVADRRPVGHDRHAEERGHRRVVRREARRVRMIGDRRDPVRPALADDQPEQTPARRQRADREPMVGIDAGGDEPLDPAVDADDPERRVARVDEIADPIDDQLEDLLDAEHARDRPGGLVDGRERRRVGREPAGGVVRTVPIDDGWGRPTRCEPTASGALRDVRTRPAAAGPSGTCRGRSPMADA